MTNPELSSPARPALQRSSSDRMLGGVCGGLAAYSGLDPVLWRVGMVALTLLGPGVLVYLLLWVLMPTAPDHVPGPLDPAIDRLHTALDGALRGRR
jgi:phage shock protein C